MKEDVLASGAEFTNNLGLGMPGVPQPGLKVEPEEPLVMSLKFRSLEDVLEGQIPVLGLEKS